jgi:hypothetical protein
MALDQRWDADAPGDQGLQLSIVERNCPLPRATETHDQMSNPS